MCEIHKARLLQPCSSGATTFGELGGQLLVSGQGPLRVGHVILEALHLGCEVSICRVSFVSIVAVKVAISSSFAATGPAWLALRSSSSFWGGHQLLQNANDLAALWCVPLTGTARQERKRAWIDHHRKPLFMVLSSQTATSTEVETWLLSPFTRACFLNHFGIQSRRGYQHESHGYSRFRLPALVLEFLTTLIFRALHGNHIVSDTI